MLTETPLPSWALGGHVQAVGGQTNRPVDDLAIVTDAGWVTVQAKKGLNRGTTPVSPLGKALSQLVQTARLGVPDWPHTHVLRQATSGRDLVIIATDERAPSTITSALSPLVARLRELPVQVPLADAQVNAPEVKAFAVLKDHLTQLWLTAFGRAMTEADLRGLLKLACVRTMHLVDGGPDLETALVILTDLVGDRVRAGNVWKALLVESQRLAEERSYLDRDSLVRRLEAAPHRIVLRPVVRLRGDIERLRDRTQVTLSALGRHRLAISAPEGPVYVDRGAPELLLAAERHTAVTGEPGAGKSVTLQALAEAASTSHDLVVLDSDALKADKSQTRAELMLDHDLSEILRGWAGDRPALLLLDGLDQPRFSDGNFPTWLPQLADDLTGSRWQIVATIRSFDLAHGPRWKRMFPGSPVSPLRAAAGLEGVQHLAIANFDQAGMAQVAAASPTLASLLDSSDDRLRALLTNPFNLDLAGQLLAEGDTGLTSIRSRAGLLKHYWDKRVGPMPGSFDRWRALKALADRMLASGRQAVGALTLPEITQAALTDLLHEGVLFQSGRPNDDLPPVGFAHPVLRDYAIARLALGDVHEAGSLTKTLCTSPNLVLAVRPSLEYRCALEWDEDPSRRRFWNMTLELASLSAGHPLAANTAVHTAVRELTEPAELDDLVAAAIGETDGPHGIWGKSEGRYVAFLLASAAARQRSTGIRACVDDAGRRLAAASVTEDDVDLANLAAQIAYKTATTALSSTTVPTSMCEIAADCLTVALRDPQDPGRRQVGETVARLTAIAAAVDPQAVSATVEALSLPTLLEAWGIGHVWPLINKLAEIAQREPQLAVALSKTVWEYEEANDAPTLLLQSALFGLSSTRSQDLESVRYMVGEHFAAMMQASPEAATDLLLQIALLPRLFRWGSDAHYPQDPKLRYADLLESSGGHGVLGTMVDEFFDGLKELATQSESDESSARLRHIIDRLIAELVNDRVWLRLLTRAAASEPNVLDEALQPVLCCPPLYAHFTTSDAATHLAARMAPALTIAQHQQVEDTVLVMTMATNTQDPERQEALERRACTILSSLDLGRLSPPALALMAGHGVEYSTPLPDLALKDPSLASIGWPGASEVAEASIVNAIREAVQNSRGDAAADSVMRTESLGRLASLWDQLTSASEDVGLTERQIRDLNVEVAERLATAAEILPGGTHGKHVLAVLKDCCPSPTSAHASAHHWGDAITPSWGVTPETLAIEGLVHLAERADWQDAHPHVGPPLAALLGSPDPVYRYLATAALPALLAEGEDLVDAIAERLPEESDPHIAARLLLHLDRVVSSEAERVDRILCSLQTDARWAVLTSSPDGDRKLGPSEEGSIVVNFLSYLALVRESPYATSVLEEWAAAPAEHPERVQAVVFWLRDVLNPLHPGTPFQDRAFAFTDRIVGAIRRDLGEHHEGNDRRANAAAVAVAISQNLYFASGAFDEKPGIQSNKQRGDTRDFASRTFPLLDQLADLDLP
ncbi:hypothetical protein [Streptacidiphilus cavernicola]|uniref:AAA+ ATPase domain-containing protein n=1 Tax=Streptacidiphilus cavernicola TaxID=3342716 RepID=A0ABV6W1Z2_9ACTN